MKNKVCIKSITVLIIVVFLSIDIGYAAFNTASRTSLRKPLDASGNFERELSSINRIGPDKADLDINLANIIFNNIYDWEGIRNPDTLCATIVKFVFQKEEYDPYIILRAILEKAGQIQYLDIYNKVLALKISKAKEGLSSIDDFKIIDTGGLGDLLVSLKPFSEVHQMDMEEASLSTLGHGVPSLHRSEEYEDFRKAAKLVNEWVRMKNAIGEDDVLLLHKVISRNLTVTSPMTGKKRPVMKGIYRVHTGSRDLLIYAEPTYISMLMKKYVVWLTDEDEKIQKGDPNALHPVVLAAQAFHRLICIHPFENGNTRTASLIMNYILMKNGFPAFILTSDNEKKFYNMERFMRVPIRLEAAFEGKGVKNKSVIDENRIFNVISDEYSIFLASQIKQRIAKIIEGSYAKPNVLAGILEQPEAGQLKQDL